MRRLFTFFTLAFLAVGASAQTITAAEWWAVGDNQYYSLGDTTGFDPGPVGTGQNWNFSSLSPTGTNITIEVENPANTPNGTTYANSDLALIVSNGEYFYYSLSGDTLYLDGERSYLSTAVSINSPTPEMIFPSNYNDTVFTMTAGTYPDGLFGGTVFRTGMIWTIFDGTGMLTTPYQTYSTANRITQVGILRDSSSTGIANADINYRRVTWYSSGKSMPVMRYFEQNIIINGGNPQISKEVWYADTLMVSAEAPQAELLGEVSLSPNPATQSSNLTYRLNGTENVQIELYSLIGQKVANIQNGTETRGLYVKEINTSGLESGVYLVRITAGDQVSSQRLMIQR